MICGMSIVEQAGRTSATAYALPVCVNFLVARPGSVDYARLTRACGVSRSDMGHFLRHRSCAPRSLCRRTVRRVSGGGLVIDVSSAILSGPCDRRVSLIDCF